jgi:hypothetical protein
MSYMRNERLELRVQTMDMTVMRGAAWDQQPLLTQAVSCAAKVWA